MFVQLKSPRRSNQATVGTVWAGVGPSPVQLVRSWDSVKAQCGMRSVRRVRSSHYNWAEKFVGKDSLWHRSVHSGWTIRRRELRNASSNHHRRATSSIIEVRRFGQLRTQSLSSVAFREPDPTRKRSRWVLNCCKTVWICGPSLEEPIWRPDAPDEYFAWWRDGGKSVIAVVDTGTFSFHVPPISIEVRDARGQIVPPTRVTPQHHIGFRFYRLSQVSDDLYDAFRNMYLAFELLLSAKYPKGVEHEIDWLRASLVASTVDLNLVSLAPAGADPVTHIIDKVYLNARLPLFHAKDGRTYFAPVTSNRDRRRYTAHCSF
jgi:hypothetical protein